MKSAPILIAVLATSLPACGSSQSPSPSGSQSTASTWNPPAAPDGYTRLTSKTVKDVPPGGDLTYCQYIMAPLDHDVDVLEVSGYQSPFGHHAVALTYVPAAGEEPGSNFPCMGTEFSAGAATDGGTADAGSKVGGGLSVGAFLGAVAGAGGGRSSTSLPEGVAFRFKQGQGIMLNVHYLNTGDVAIDGNAVVDLKFADPDPTRTIASMFLNLNFGFSVAPTVQTTSTIDCVAQSDVKIIMMANHMHEYGTSAITEVHPAGGGAVQQLHDDPTWAFDMQFNPVFTHWGVAAPFTIRSGDTIRTTCNWDNPTATTMTFPREMCLGVGFALATGDNPTVPICMNGTWRQNGI
jgi:hypothetical protein